MTLPIRYAPSGPVLANGNDPNNNQPGGAPLTPGAGMQLRLSEVSATTTLVLTAGIAQIGAGNGFECELSTPNPGYNYRAVATVNLSSTSGTAVARLTLETSLDEGANWTTLKTGSFTIGAATETRQAVLIQEMALGSAPGSWNIDATDYPSLMLRLSGELLSGTDASVVAPAGVLSLFELF